MPRGKGEGSIVKRPDGRWEARIVVGKTEAGNPKRQSVYGKTRKEVAEKLNKALTEQQGGRLLKPTGLTVAQFLEQWLEHKGRKLEPTTIGSYRYVIDHHVKPQLGHHKLEALEPLTIERMQTELAKAGLSPRTVRYARGLLFSALKQAVRWRLIPHNPAEAVDAPRQAKVKRVALDRDQARRFLDTVRGERLEALWRLAITTGMRRAELLGLRWQDVDLERGEISISNTVPFVQGKPIQKGTKTEAGERRLSIDPGTVALLRDRREAIPLERERAGEKWHENDLVFGSSLGTPLYESTLRREKARLLEKAGLPHVTVHGLRYSYVSLAAQRGLDVKVVAERVGHKSTRVTQDIYQQTFPEMHRAAALSPEDLLGSPTTPEATAESAVEPSSAVNLPSGPQKAKGREP